MEMRQIILKILSITDIHINTFRRNLSSSAV